MSRNDDVRCIHSPLLLEPTRPCYMSVVEGAMGVPLKVHNTSSTHLFRYLTTSIQSSYLYKILPITTSTKKKKSPADESIVTAAHGNHFLETSSIIGLATASRLGENPMGSFL